MIKPSVAIPLRLEAIFVRKLAEIFIPIKLTNSNDGQGKNWYRTVKERSKFRDYLHLHQLHRNPFDQPVTLRIVRVIGKRQTYFDEDSILRGNSKELIDSLREAGWFEDDSRKYIQQVIGSQIIDRKLGPAIIVQVWSEPLAFPDQDNFDHL